MKSNKFLITSLLILITCLIGVVTPVKAELSSIGVSPATISVNNLLPGLSTIREIVVSRSDVSKAQTFIIITDNSEVSSWLTFSPGNQFVIPEGQKTVSVNVTINIPLGIEFKNYSASMRIVAQDDLNSNQVSIQTGVITKIELVVTDKQIASFKILSARIADHIVNSDLNLALKIENDGNVPTGPAKIILKIYNSSGSELVTLEDVNAIFVDPLTITEKNVVFSGSNLTVGEYLAKLTIFDAKQNLISTTDLSFKVLVEPIEPGTEDHVFGSDSIINYALIILGIVLICMALIKFYQSSRRSEKSH